MTFLSFILIEISKHNSTVENASSGVARGQGETVVPGRRAKGGAKSVTKQVF